MDISLPPGTQSFKQLGNITVQISPIYLNKSLSHPQYSLKLWGISHPISMNPSNLHSHGQPGMTSVNANNNNSTQINYSRNFPVTTNLHKLTAYFHDMAVLIVVLADARTHKDVGVGFLKIRRFIVNFLICDFEDKIQIIPANEAKNNTYGAKRTILGQVLIKMKISVPIHAVSVPKNTNLNHIPTNPFENQNRQMSRNDNRTDRYQNQSILDNENDHRHGKNIYSNQSDLKRKLIVEPHIFQQQSIGEGKYKQFVIHNNARSQGAHINPQVPKAMDPQQNQMHAILTALRTHKNSRPTVQKVLSFLQQDSLSTSNKYPNLSQLYHKYGKSNVLAQRMRLKLDQAMYLNPVKQMQQNRQNNGNIAMDEDYLVKVKNINFMVSPTTASQTIADVRILHTVSQRDNTIINEMHLKDIHDAGIYFKNIIPGNAIQFQNKLYKAKAVVRNSNLQGQPLKLYVKRKDNNKKIAQFDLNIQKLFHNKGKKPQISPTKPQVNLYQTHKKQKSHFYISIRPIQVLKNLHNGSSNSQKQKYKFFIHPQCQKDPVNGKKMIFTADNTHQNIKIKIIADDPISRIQSQWSKAQNRSKSKHKKQQQIERNKGKEQTENQQHQDIVEITINPTIKMKQQIIQASGHKFRVFMASADSIQNLMKMVVLHDNPSSVQPANNTEHNFPSEPHHSNNRSPPKNIYHSLSRPQKLSLLFQCMLLLCQSTNPAVMPVIQQLLSNPLTHNQQLPLFIQILTQSGMPQQRAQFAATAVFDLLHSDFTMFWTCFQTYKKWNDNYNTAIKAAINKFIKCIQFCVVEQDKGKNNGQSGYYQKTSSTIRKKVLKILQKAIDKISNNRQCLFGLLPTKTCHKVLSDYLSSKLLPSQLSNSSLVPTFAQKQQQSQILSAARFSKLLIALEELLSLLCRYTGTEGDVHCISIQEFITLVSSTGYISPNADADRQIYINQHQIMAVAMIKQNGMGQSMEQPEQQMAQRQPKQLLFEVVLSCISDNTHFNSFSCSRLKKLLSQPKSQTQTEQSSQIQNEQQPHHHIQTQNNTHNVYTEGPERFMTEQEVRRQGTEERENKYKKEHEQRQNQKPIKLKIRDVILNPDSDQFITVAQIQNADICIIDTDTHQKQTKQLMRPQEQIVCKFKFKELPKIVKLQDMKDYKVRVALYEQDIINERSNNKQSWKFEGVFIANQKINQIVLYNAEKQGQTQIGHIKLSPCPNPNKKPSYPHSQSEQQSQLIIQIKNQQNFVDPLAENSQGDIKKRLQLQLQQQMKRQQDERNRLTRQPVNVIIPSQWINYKILSISPAPRTNQQYLLKLQDCSINYPTNGTMGKIQNPKAVNLQLSLLPSPSSPFVGSVPIQSQSFPNTVGIHQVCFTNTDNTVNALVTIQLQQYIGNQVLQNQNETVRRVLILNLYHIIAVKDKILCNSSTKDKIFTIVVTNDSSTQPLFIKDIPQNPLVKNPYLQPHCAVLRQLWLGLSTRVQPSKKYGIHVYARSTSPQALALATRIGRKYTEDDLMAHFQFQIKYHPESVGIFQNKGFLVDQRGYRLAMTLLQINYNDVFSRDKVGRQKFQSLLSIFPTENLLNLNVSLNSPEQLSPLLHRQLGLNNTQQHLLLSLQQPSSHQIYNLLTNWDCNVLLKSENINLQHYSTIDLYGEYQIYDFDGSGLIRQDKANIVQIIVFGNQNKQQPRKKTIDADKCLIQGRDGWVKDLKSKEKQGYVDYILLLWCLRLYASVDNYFIQGQVSHKQISSTNQNNTTIKPNNPQVQPNTSISKIKATKIQMLSYKNLKISQTPSTLIFYLNGQKVAEPILRCFSHQYSNPKTIYTSWPILLEIYEKKYGVRELYTEQLVQAVRVYEEKVDALGGIVFFMIDQDTRDDVDINSVIKPKIPTRPSRNTGTQERQKQDWNTNGAQTNPLNNSWMSNPFRKSRREKWQNYKQSQQARRMKQITEILNK